MKIWWQSFIDSQTSEAYIARLTTYLNTIASPGTTVEVHGITPPDRGFSRLSEFRCAISAINNGIEAAERGYDAVVMGHFQDPGLYELKSAVAIPVIGTGEVIRSGGRFVKNTTGYDLTQLLIGSEGTLGLVTEATLRLHPRLAHTASILAPFASIDEVAQVVPRIVVSGVAPMILEYIDRDTMKGLLRTSDPTLTARSSRSGTL